jgi:hypothetical protein
MCQWSGRGGLYGFVSNPFIFGQSPDFIGRITQGTAKNTAFFIQVTVITKVGKHNHLIAEVNDLIDVAICKCSFF